MNSTVHRITCLHLIMLTTTVLITATVSLIFWPQRTEVQHLLFSEARTVRNRLSHFPTFPVCPHNWSPRMTESGERMQSTVASPKSH